MAVCYITKSRIIGPRGQIEPGMVLRDTKEFDRIGLEVSKREVKISRWAAEGHIVLCDESQILDVIRGKKILPAVSFGNTAGLGDDDRVFTKEADNDPHANDPTNKFGWDPRYLAEQDVTRLRSMVKQVLPELAEEQIRQYERNRMIDILSSRHASNVSNEATRVLPSL